MMRILVFFILGLFTFSGCQMPTTQADSAKVNHFFDLQAWAKQEAAFWKTLPKPKRLLVLDGKTETDSLGSPNTPEQDLAIIGDCDLNKLAWIDKYTTEKMTDAAGLQVTIYKAIDKKLRTQLLEIGSNAQNQVQYLYIENSTTNMLTNTMQKIRYQRGKQYSIINKQSLFLAAPIALELTYSWE